MVQIAPRSFSKWCKSNILYVVKSEFRIYKLSDTSNPVGYLLFLTKLRVELEKSRPVNSIKSHKKRHLARSSAFSCPLSFDFCQLSFTLCSMPYAFPNREPARRVGVRRTNPQSAIYNIKSHIPRIQLVEIPGFASQYG